MYTLHFNRSNGNILQMTIALKMAHAGWQSKTMIYLRRDIFDLACRHALVGWEEREEEVHAITSSTPWKPASIKTSHQHNFTFYSQFAEITRWLLNSGPDSTFRKRLSRAVAGWVEARSGGLGNVFNPNLMCKEAQKRATFLHATVM